MASAAATYFGIIAVLFIVAFSPLALRGMSVLPGMNWGELSNVGQTYGAVSAILSALALIGVAISVALQRRESRFSRLEASRTRHHEMVLLALENPSYLQVIEGPSHLALDVRRFFVYINLYLQYWQMLWEFSDISVEELRVHARGIFSNDVGCEYWRRNGYLRQRNDNTKKEREFDRILDAVYREVVASGVSPAPVLDSESIAPIGRNRVDSKACVTVAAVLVCGMVLGRCAYINGNRTR